MAYHGYLLRRACDYIPNTPKLFALVPVMEYVYLGYSVFLDGLELLGLEAEFCVVNGDTF